jgi:putative flippase GtrA
MKNLLTRFINLLHYPVRYLIPEETFKYGFCGGLNLCLDTVLYFLFFNFIFNKQDVDIYITVLSSHIASLFSVFPITFIIGFLLNKYIVFTTSNLTTNIQFKRYLMSGLLALILSYLSMKFLVDYLNLYPTPSRFTTIIITVLTSYLLQRNFTFKQANIKK